MSEQLSTQPQAIHTEIAGREIAIVKASNGQQRYYEVDAEGNKTRMSNQEFGAIAKTEENAQDTALFGRINEAIDNGSLNEFSAGPDYREATGLSREQVMARGHKGYKEVVEAAKDHKAAQETAAATKQAERAARRERLEGLLAAQALRNADKARIADFHASNRERAQKWRKEADALKDARSPKTSALRDRLKTMSYKEKLELGGEQGIARLQQAAEKADEKHAAEEVRYHHVHKPSQKSLESQAATVAAIKEFNRGNPAKVERSQRGVNEFYPAKVKLKELDVALKGLKANAIDKLKPEISKEKHISVVFGSAEKRLKGEDITLIDEQQGLYGVFDGMGSGPNAKLAAQTVSNAIHTAFEITEKDLGKPTTVQEAIDNMKIGFQFARQKWAEKNNRTDATTAAVMQTVEVDGKTYAVVGAAGDSRIIRLRDGQLMDLTPEQCEPERRNYLTNCIADMHSGEDDFFEAYEIEPGDKILLCTDGITGDFERDWLSSEEMRRAFSQASPDESAKMFVELSKKVDDKSAIVVFFGEGDITQSADELGLNEEGVLDLDEEQTPPQDAGQSPVAVQPAPVPAVRPIHRPATRPNTQPRRRGFRGFVAAGVAAIAALGVWAGFTNNSGESMAAATGISQLKDRPNAPEKADKSHELSPETIAAAQKQAAKLKAEAELYKNQTEVTGASGETATTKPLERGSNPWDESRKMLEAYGLPTTEANIDAVDKAIQKRMGQIDYTRMSVGMQVPWFGEDRVRQILGDYDNTTPGK